MPDAGRCDQELGFYFKNGGLTALMIAVKNDRIDCVRLLLAAGADTEIRLKSVRVSSREISLFFDTQVIAYAEQSIHSVLGTNFQAFSNYCSVCNVNFMEICFHCFDMCVASKNFFSFHLAKRVDDRAGWKHGIDDCLKYEWARLFASAVGERGK
jgi:ankyrin repeat protein